jgi:hypothetical protein
LSVNTQLGRKRRANFGGSVPRRRRRRPPSSSGTRRSRGSPASWSRRVCPSRTCSRLARKRMLSSLSCSRQPPLCAPPSSRRRSRSRVSCSSCSSLVG